jgi:hypothetical protein
MLGLRPTGVERLPEAFAIVATCLSWDGRKSRECRTAVKTFDEISRDHHVSQASEATDHQGHHESGDLHGSSRISTKPRVPSTRILCPS